MNQWDTADWQFPHGIHPCVIISPDARCTNQSIDTVNVVAGSTHRANRPPRVHEVLLDSTDGMNWETLIRIDVWWLVKKTELRLRGEVTLERRRELGAKIIKLYGFWMP